eukprot:scaffold28748_cov64-Phaeocystis_antarctica.AAC.15
MAPEQMARVARSSTHGKPPLALRLQPVPLPAPIFYRRAPVAAMGHGEERDRVGTGVAAAARPAMALCAAAPSQDGYGSISGWHAAEAGRLGRASADPTASPWARRGGGGGGGGGGVVACVVVRAQPRAHG